MTHRGLSSRAGRLVVGIAALGVAACAPVVEGEAGSGSDAGGMGGTAPGSGGSGGTAVGGGSGGGVASGGSSAGTFGSGGSAGVVGSGGAGTGGNGTGGFGQGGTETGGSGGSSGSGDDLNSGPNTMGWIGCSMGENTAAGYRRIGGTRMWGGYGNGGAVVQQWTTNNSAAWNRFRNQVQQNGEPVAVWIMICIFAQAGATAQEVNAMIENARENSAPGVTIYLTGQPLYDPGHVCTLAGANGPESTDQLAQQVAAQHPDVIYPGALRLTAGEVAGDTCHANTQGEDSLGRQARAFWGQP